MINQTNLQTGETETREYVYHAFRRTVAQLGPLCLLVAMCMASGFALARESSVKIIDTHAHFLPGEGLDFAEAIASAVRAMDRFGVVMSLMMSPPRGRIIERNYDYPDFQSVMKKHGRRFLFLAGGGTLNPLLHRYSDPVTVTNAVKKEFAAIAHTAIDAGAKGFGEMSSLHVSLSPAHGYFYVPADHPLLLLLADIAAERDVPLDLHMDAQATSKKPTARLSRYPKNPEKFPATLAALERLLVHNRKAKIIWAHGGTDHLGDFSPQVIRRFMDRHPNLYMSLKVVGRKAPTLNKLISGNRISSPWLSLLRRHSDRFVIGTDNFYVGSASRGGGPISAFSQKNAPKLSGTVHFLSLLSADLARKIGSQNAIRLFKLGSIDTVSAPSVSDTGPLAAPVGNKRLCRDGNMEHCRVACSRGIQPACNRLRRGR